MPKPASVLIVTVTLAERGTLGDQEVEQAVQEFRDRLGLAADTVTFGLEHRPQPCHSLEGLAAALLVVVLNRRHHAWMTRHDPTALRQAKKALQAAGYSDQLARPAPASTPAPEQLNYLEQVFGYGTLDDLAEVLTTRIDDHDVADVAEIKRRMATYGPDALWDEEVGPMLGRLESLLGLDKKAWS
jgi:hypothetical protein